MWILHELKSEQMKEILFFIRLSHNYRVIVIHLVVFGLHFDCLIEDLFC
jgi:hypothetical protein